MVSVEQIKEALRTQRSVILALPDTPQNRADEGQFDKLEQLLNDDSEGARKLLAEIAEFIQFGHLYWLTIHDLGPIQPQEQPNA